MRTVRGSRRRIPFQPGQIAGVASQLRGNAVIGMSSHREGKDDDPWREVADVLDHQPPGFLGVLQVCIRQSSIPPLSYPRIVAARSASSARSDALPRVPVSPAVRSRIPTLYPASTAFNRVPAQVSSTSSRWAARARMSTGIVEYRAERREKAERTAELSEFFAPGRGQDARSDLRLSSVSCPVPPNAWMTD